MAILVPMIALLFVGTSCAGSHLPRGGAASDAINPSKRMPDGKAWTTKNLNRPIAESYCYADAELNCREYGRLYSWQSAQLACHSLGDGWRLPTNDDWRELANHYGGIRDASPEAGRAAYTALSVGGSSGFEARLGGGRAPDGSQYARLDAHGFYWTASETGPSAAWFYNFGKGQLSLGRHDDGEKQRAFSVRCVRG
ncbi:MAG: fibrobacter succinogenes major paralogous domain-containing protein [Vicinamibacterales bacterium]